ncbi:hypothetical protein CBS63078_5756 [Aspergillus niger]|uniref:Uncharacterized protein n=1 Tax=Aspergillus niger TaxID=5061 RepID=A0A9W6A1W6_ASPNG|nr:hypothetical protein CBS12448_4284 [Aspergillus niger]KAI2897956.1 hypothetical protein CBS13152_2735 [Aspergillus niger]KAI2903925.1 hypothetical protein CBS63078_5756 [Aspergillus niger]KAI2927019.1 hypothetical protein CBS147320_5650 [Aspergillus niger]KAI2928629.1 hypothetical protein CBS147321_11013 [Aspergillus niger]
MARWSYQSVKGDGDNEELTLCILCGPPTVISNTTPSSTTTLSSLLKAWAKDLVLQSSSNCGVLASVNGYGQFRLWLSAINQGSFLTFEETVDRATNFFLQADSVSACFSFTAASSFDFGCLLSIIRAPAACDTFVPIINHSLVLKKARKDLCRGAPWLVLISLSILLFVICVVVSARLRLTFRGSSASSSPDTFWLQWNTSHSLGLEHQLQFTRPWSSFLDYFGEERREQPWFVRLDDQSMVPFDLIDESEQKYQRWFQERYPEMEQIRQSGDYLNTSFWENPYGVQIATDALFHPAHCLLALRRYWRARETGRHVCPRDIDFHHVKHCLDSLDAVLFVDDVAKKSPLLPQDSDNRMPWLVNACF